MKKMLLLIVLAISICSCGSSKKATGNLKTIEKGVRVSKSAHHAAATNIISFAQSYVGTKYKYGGTSNKGMDCSGLVFLSFKHENIELPRVSRDMALRGAPISLSQAKEGDLLFFQTNKNRKVINHVGLITSIQNKLIKFIHSTTSRGVIESTLDESYWKNAFVEARRIL